MAPKARILAIDEQPDTRSFLADVLAAEGFEVHAAPDLAPALAALAEQPRFDLVILDLEIARRGNSSAVSQIRRAAPWAKIVMLTSVGDVGSVVCAMREGASDYLLKPVARESLLRSIESVLGQRESRQERALDEFKGRLALHERAVTLLGASDLEAAARGVLQLLSTEVGARKGRLWVRRSSEPGLALRAREPEDDQSEPPLEWCSPDAGTEDRLQSGTIVLQLGSSSASRHTLVPFLDDQGLMAVAQLDAVAEGQMSALETGQKLGTLLLGNAERISRLSASSLRDERTELPTRAYLEAVLETEVAKAYRFGHQLACLCIEPRDANDSDPRASEVIARTLSNTLRGTDVLCSEGANRFWVLVTSTDTLGGVVLKRRLATRVESALEALGIEAPLALGLATYPLDAELGDALLATALERALRERESCVHQLGLEDCESLGELGSVLLGRAERMPARLVPETAEFLVSELTSRPRELGLLFLAPGPDAAAVNVPLSSLRDAELSSEVFIATDGDTVPCGDCLTAVMLPANLSARDTWIVRFGEAPPYALVAGPRSPDGTRPVFHSCDAGLVEHITFRLRSEVGFGMRL